MTAAATQTVSQKAKEPPAPAALTQRFLMSSLRSKGRKLTPTGCTRSSGTMTPGRLVCLNKRMFYLLCIPLEFMPDKVLNHTEYLNLKAFLKYWKTYCRCENDKAAAQTG